MMKEIQIKTTSPPIRCEVCHQSDQFDALNNFCARCHGVTALSINNSNQVSTPVIDKVTQEKINQTEWENADNWSDQFIGLYFSKRDSRIWVPKRDPGLGYTLNLAHQRGALWFLGLSIFPTLLLVLIIIIIAMIDISAKR